MPGVRSRYHLAIEAFDSSRPGGRILGDFTIHEQLGAGAGGVIYRAEQRGLGRDAVVKLLHVRASDTSDRADRFLREARLASRLDHPYAAHIYAFGAEPDGVLWIAMERVRGSSLAQVLASQPERRMPPGRFAQLLELICEVVHAAHERGIVHRDLKPSNIMVVGRAGRLLPKLLDFGIAKQLGDHAPHGEATWSAEVADPALTQPGDRLGSPYYMAPEQWTDGAVDARADIYALGVLAFEALTGRVPFTGRSAAELARAHLTAEVPALPADLPAALGPVLRAALAKQPADRPATALAFAEAVRLATGANLSVDALPRLDAQTRLDAAWLPQPLAEAVAGFESACNPHQARDAVVGIIHLAVRYLGLVALAARSRSIPVAGDPPVAAALLRELYRRALTDAEWLALIAALVAPFAAAPDGYPVPELVELVGRGVARFAPLALAEDAAAIGEAALRDRLVALMPALARLIQELAFLTDYQLVVPRPTGGEVWMGPRRQRRPLIALAGDLPEGLPVLVDLDGRPVLALAPLVQVAAPSPGAAEEMFLFAGGRKDRSRTAVLVAEPGFEREDATLWDWFRAHLLAVDDAAPPALSDAPYRGLAAFTEADAGRFFGRERAAEAFANQLVVHPLVAVVGPSGAGKSSFVRAGVVPRLPAGWRAVVVRPGAAPLAALAARLDLVAGDPGALADQVRAAAGAGTLVIIVDQCEELFTLCRDPDERSRFTEILALAARSVEDPVRVILTLRDDFLARAGELDALRDRLARGLTLLATPSPDDLVRALVEPARQVGYRFDDRGLPCDMVRAVAGRPGAMALLSFTAARLWELRDRHFSQLTRAAYDAIGGVEGALAGHAEATLLACATEQRRVVRALFRRLVTAEGTRAVVARGELAAVLGDEAAGAAVIERLITARLLVTAETESGEDCIEVIHEALLTSWPRLVEWRREDAEGARLRDQLRAAALQWHDRGRPRGLLWRDDALDDYRRWRKRWPGAIPALELAFATASLRDEARGRRLRRSIAGAALGVLIAGAAALAVMYRASSRNAAAAHDRLVQSYVEQGRRLLLDGEYLRALPYLAEAYAQGDESTAVRILLGRAERLASAELAVHHHAGHRSAAAFRPDGTHIISASDNGEAAVWEAATGRVVASLPGRPGDLSFATASRDGSFVAIPSRDGVLVWDGAATREIASGRPDRLAIDAAGTRIAVMRGRELSAWTVDRGERLWTTSTDSDAGLAWWSGDAVVIQGNDHAVRIVDGRGALRLATSGPVSRVYVTEAGQIGTISGVDAELWDSAGKRLARITGREPATALALSRDGRLLAIGGNDRVVRLYETATGAALGDLPGHRGAVSNLAFSADARQLVSEGDDLTVRLWDVRARRETARVLGVRDQFVAFATRFDATAQRLVVPTWDGAVRVLATADPGLALTIDAGADIWSGDFIADGSRFATSSSAAVQTWASGTGEKLAALTIPTGAPSRISPDGTLAVIVLPGTSIAEIREMATGALVARLEGSGPLLLAAFDHASRRIVTGSANHLVELWDLRGARLATLRGHGDEIVAVAFSADDRLIASGSADRTARVWDAATARELCNVAGGDYMTSVDFDPTGTRLVTGNGDRLVRLWDIPTGAPSGSFEQATSVRAASVSYDGTLLAVATKDGAVNVWDRATASLLVQFHHQDSAETAVFRRDGTLLSASVDHHAALWHVDAEHRSRDIVTDFVRCHAPYALLGMRLEPITPSCPAE